VLTGLFPSLDGFEVQYEKEWTNHMIQVPGMVWESLLDPQHLFNTDLQMNTPHTMARVIHTCTGGKNQVLSATVAPPTPTTAIQAFVQKEKREQETNAERTETIQRVLEGEQCHAIRQQQSLVLVQIMLHASVSAYSYLWRLLIWHSFRSSARYSISGAFSQHLSHDFVLTL
jgi:hypothetical protein